MSLRLHLVNESDLVNYLDISSQVVKIWVEIKIFEKIREITKFREGGTKKIRRGEGPTINHEGGGERKSSWSAYVCEWGREFPSFSLAFLIQYKVVP